MTLIATANSVGATQGVTHPMDEPLGCHLTVGTEAAFFPSLARLAPKLARSKEMETLLAPSVLLQNDTLQTIVAYDLRWTVEDAAGSVTVHDSSFSEPHVLVSHQSGGGLSIPPGSVRMIGPGYNLSQTQLADFTGAPLTAGGVVSRPSVKVVKVVIDGVIFDDGQFRGPNESHYFERFKAGENAKHDAGVAVLKGAQDELSDEELMTRLSEEAGKRTSYSATTPHDFYFTERGIMAEQLALVLRQYGRAALLANARRLAREPKYTLIKKD